MKQKLFLSLALFIAGIMCANAQVTIGSNNNPHSASVLDLQLGESVKKGFKLPSVALEEDKTVFVLEPDTDKSTASGMMVFNTSDKNVYIWDGGSWKMFSDSGNTGIGTGNISTSGSVPSVEAAGGNTGTIVLSTDCSGSGIWTVLLLSGEGATLSNVNSDMGTFEIDFTANTSTSSRTAVVAVKDPCGYAKNLVFTQKGILNPGDYTPTPPTGISLGMSGISCFDVRGSLSSEEAYEVSVSGAKSIDKVTWYIEDEQGVLGVYSPSSSTTQALPFKSQSEVLSLATANNNVVSVKLIAYLDITLSDNSAKQVLVEKNVSFRNGTCCAGYLAEGGAYVTSNTNQYLAIPDGTTLAKLKTDYGFYQTGADLCWAQNDVKTTTVTWANAKSLCSSLGEDWRLPNIAELGHIQGVHSTLATNGASGVGTTNMQTNVYWSSTEYNSAHAVHWRFHLSTTYYNNKTTNFYARCVRTL